MLTLIDALPPVFLVFQVGSELLLCLCLFPRVLAPLQKLYADSREGGETGMQMRGEGRRASLGGRTDLTWYRLH